MDNALQIYNDYILPLTLKSQNAARKNKVVSIGAAVALTALILFRENVLKPPRRTRHLPHVPFFTFLRTMIQGWSIRDTAYKVTLPVAVKSPTGLYTVL